jgi:hypothetical protein
VNKYQFTAIVDFDIEVDLDHPVGSKVKYAFKKDEVVAQYLSSVLELAMEEINKNGTWCKVSCALTKEMEPA